MSGLKLEKEIERLREALELLNIHGKVMEDHYIITKTEEALKGGDDE